MSKRSYRFRVPRVYFVEFREPRYVLATPTKVISLMLGVAFTAAQRQRLYSFYCNTYKPRGGSFRSLPLSPLFDCTQPVLIHENHVNPEQAPELV